MQGVQGVQGIMKACVYVCACVCVCLCVYVCVWVGAALLPCVWGRAAGAGRAGHHAGVYVCMWVEYSDFLKLFCVSSCWSPAYIHR